MSEVVRRGAVVHGRVQGVGFRWAARDEARRLELLGSARNLPDGTVRVEIQGPPDRVDVLVEWLRTGPPSARVDRVEVEELPVADDDPDAGFRVG